MVVNLFVVIEGFVILEICGGGGGVCRSGLKIGIVFLGFLIGEICICFFLVICFGFIVWVCFGVLNILFILKFLLCCGKVCDGWSLGWGGLFIVGKDVGL